MNGTKIIRRVDDLGRVVIPKEIRCALGIHEGDGLEICVGEDSVTFRKYDSPKPIEYTLANLITAVERSNLTHRQELLQDIYALRSRVQRDMKEDK